MTLHSIYTFLTGAGFQISLFFCFSGITLKCAAFLMEAKKRDRAFFAFYSPRFAARSIVAHTLPFVSRTWKINPFTTIFTFSFHLSFLFIALFHSAHVVLIKHAFSPGGIPLPMLPDAISFILSLVCVASLAALSLRRVFAKTLRYLTLFRDHLLNIAILALLGTGIWSHLQFPGFFMATLLHILSGNLLIVLIPFTRLSHLFMIPFTRGYMGSEFGRVRCIKDW